jgi:hypothetical protein
MSDDIVERLRAWGDNAGPETAGLHMKAADEIERLRADAAMLRVLLAAPPTPAPYIPQAPHWPHYPTVGDFPPTPSLPGCQCPPGANLTCQAPLCPRKPLQSAIGTWTAP